jgi:hypothetical protein
MVALRSPLSLEFSQNCGDGVQVTPSTGKPGVIGCLAGHQEQAVVPSLTFTQLAEPPLQAQIVYCEVSATAQSFVDEHATGCAAFFASLKYPFTSRLACGDEVPIPILPPVCRNADLCTQFDITPLVVWVKFNSVSLHNVNPARAITSHHSVPAEGGNPPR